MPILDSMPNSISNTELFGTNTELWSPLLWVGYTSTQILLAVTPKLIEGSEEYHPVFPPSPPLPSPDTSVNIYVNTDAVFPDTSNPIIQNMSSYPPANDKLNNQQNQLFESECDLPRSTITSSASIKLNKVPVIVRARASRSESAKVRGPKKNNCQVLNEVSLPVVINLNPRSAYGKEEEIKTLISQYDCSVLTISESWSRANFPLSKLIDI